MEQKEIFSKAETETITNQEAINMIFFVHFRESSGPLTAKIDSTNADLELKVDVNKNSPKVH